MSLPSPFLCASLSLSPLSASSFPCVRCVLCARLSMFSFRLLAPLCARASLLCEILPPDPASLCVPQTVYLVFPTIGLDELLAKGVD